jgi:hypothetical protein
MITGGVPVLDAAGWKQAGTYDMSNLADIINDATKGARTLAQAHPKAKVLLTCCDFTPAPVANALRQAKRESVVVVARYDNQSSLEAIRKDAPPVIIAAANADQSVLVAVDQILANKAKKTPPSPEADDGKYELTVLDKTNVPAAGKYHYDPDTQIADYVKKWKSEYKK